ncbi:OmpA family protein [Caballeronia sp. Lep1P3]|uniref:OmpA family protein n=1 Tax=Caballeronia sp. Lep1P3 TaxID=2878150 RepID=UPI001FD1BEC6|nr:OmpA family protein [Caballeronia sp. Lep1P3]
MFKKTVALLLAAAAVLAGFSTASAGPTFNLKQIQTSNGQRAFRAECYGLFESSSSCMQAAQDACGNEPVRVLQNVEGTEASGDPREVVFVCGAAAAPVAQPAQAVEPQPVVAAAPAVVDAAAPAPVRKVALDEKTNFAFDSAKLSFKAKSILDRIVADGRGVTFSSVVVAGYTDSTGSAPYNVALSKRRAQSVLDYLRSHGLRANNYATNGYGESNPSASNSTSAGRAENRRVEIVLTQ